MASAYYFPNKRWSRKKDLQIGRYNASAVVLNNETVVIVRERVMTNMVIDPLHVRCSPFPDCPTYQPPQCGTFYGGNPVTRLTCFFPEINDHVRKFKYPNCPDGTANICLICLFVMAIIRVLFQFFLSKQAIICQLPSPWPPLHLQKWPNCVSRRQLGAVHTPGRDTAEPCINSLRCSWISSEMD